MKCEKCTCTFTPYRNETKCPACTKGYVKPKDITELSHFLRHYEYRLPWPINLYTAIFGREYHDIPDDASETVEYLLSRMGKNERLVILNRFKYGMPCVKIADLLSVSSGRVYQIIVGALGLLSSSRYLPYLVRGKRIQEKVTESMTENYHGYSIEKLNLSSKVNNILRREGIQTLGDLSKTTKTILLDIKGIGPKSLEDIVSGCQEYLISIRD